MTAADAPDETELLAGLRAGDDAAFETLVRSHGGRLLAVARRYLESEEDARDAVQDAFLSVFRNIGSFQGDARLSTWMHRIVVNAALMKLRTRRRKPEEPIDDLLPRFQADGHFADTVHAWADPAESAADALARQQEADAVRAAIARLPDGHREVLMLRDIDGLDTAETAKLLEVSQNAVKTRLHRARQALRGILATEREKAA